APIGAVPDGDREHALDAIEQAVTPLLVPVREHLRVAARLEGVSELLQLFAQRHKIVNLTVDDDSDAPVLVVDPLVPARDVDDGQAAVTETAARAYVIALAVGTARGQRRGHRPQRRLVYYRAWLAAVTRGDETGDSAHGALTSSATR